MALRNYKDNQIEKVPETLPLTPSGVACTGSTCEGEMGWVEPREVHPELKTLNRARCLVCNWRGWV